MNIVFMGTPEFAVPSLTKFLSSHHQISAVVTVPDKPAGRGQKVTFSAVKKVALDAGLPVLQPDKLNDPQFIQQLKSCQAELFIVVAFRILPESVFTIPQLGTINLHASLLPALRGAAPINWALINGDTESGVTSFFIEKQVDTGNILLQHKVGILSDMTAGELHDLLSIDGALVLFNTVQGIENQTLFPVPQTGHVTLAPKITKELCQINWAKSAPEINNLIRGLSPYPGAFTYLQKRIMKILFSKPVVGDNTDYIPGTIVKTDKNGTFIVQTGNGLLSILRIKPEGKREMNIDEFTRGNNVNTLEVLTATPGND